MALKTLMTLLVICLISCKTGQPRIEKQPKFFSGKSSIAGIISTPENCEGEIIDLDGEQVCYISVDIEIFNNFVCVSNEDNTAIWKYIIELNRRCKEWKE